jgi:hypothetical protein
MSENTTNDSAVSDPLLESTNGAQPDAPLSPPPPPGDTPVLQKLSTPPFPRSGLPLLGILASVYEHVTAVAARMRCGGQPPSKDEPA